MPWQFLAFLREEGVARSVTEGVAIARNHKLRGNPSHKPTLFIVILSEVRLIDYAYGGASHFDFTSFRS